MLPAEYPCCSRYGCGVKKRCGSFWDGQRAVGFRRRGVPDVKPSWVNRRMTSGLASVNVRPSPWAISQTSAWSSVEHGVDAWLGSWVPVAPPTGCADAVLLSGSSPRLGVTWGKGRCDVSPVPGLPGRYVLVILLRRGEFQDCAGGVRMPPGGGPSVVSLNVRCSMTPERRHFLALTLRRTKRMSFAWWIVAK